VEVGITFHAQEQLGDVVFIQPPEPGSLVKQGNACAVIESVKSASDIHAPVSGVVFATNQELAARPELVNSDPYGAWMFRIKAGNPDELGALLDAAGYRKFVGS
jgi:glycine cleavage system H protein